ncbi:MAG: DegT/DnrJ/EryC1/StrS family aminotransferase, partial [Nitrospira sp.]
IAGETLDWVPDDDITMVEDACQAIGAKPLTGIAACYSFYPAKILGCYGDGGAIATNDESLYEELKIMRNHYKGDWKPYGYNSRLDNLQAAVLNVKLKYLPADLLRRKQIALMYDRDLIGVGLPKVRDVYQDYIISYEDRDGLKNWLTSQGIETMENGYPFPAGLYKGKRAEKYESESLRIPCNPDLTDEEVNYVIEKINEYTQK